MTLFVTAPRRSYEISEIYIMRLCFLISYAVVPIVKAVFEKQNRKNPKNMPNPRVGSIGLKFADDNELNLIILSYICDNENYLVKDPLIKELIFSLVKATLQNESLVLTPNMIRFLALKLINNDQTLLTWKYCSFIK